MKSFKAHNPDAVSLDPTLRDLHQGAPPATPIQLTAIDAEGCSDRGQRRDTNEDNFVVARLSRNLVPGESRVPIGGQHATEALLIAVADGMGGHRRGDVASAVALQTFTDHLFRSAPSTMPETAIDELELVHVLTEGFHAAQEAVNQADATNRDPDPRPGPMGTTLTSVYVTPFRAYLCHVGDSRCYLVRDGSASCLTTDHTMAERLAAESAAAGERLRERWGHVLWNAIGAGDRALTVENRLLTVRRGDALVLCTDGLTTHLSAEQIAARAAAASAATACQDMVQAANAAGGTDNITAVVARL